MAGCQDKVWIFTNREDPGKRWDQSKLIWQHEDQEGNLAEQREKHRKEGGVLTVVEEILFVLYAYVARDLFTFHLSPFTYLTVWLYLERAKSRSARKL